MICCHTRDENAGSTGDHDEGKRHARLIRPCGELQCVARWRSGLWVKSTCRFCACGPISHEHICSAATTGGAVDHHVRRAEALSAMAAHSSEEQQRGAQSLRAPCSRTRPCAPAAVPRRWSAGSWALRRRADISAPPPESQLAGVGQTKWQRGQGRGLWRGRGRGRGRPGEGEDENEDD